MQEIVVVKNKMREITYFSFLLAFEIFFCFTPLGSIPIGPIVATLAMLPVILSGILFSKRFGLIMGFLAGLFSFLVWTFMPPMPAIAFIFTPFYNFGEINGSIFSLIICFVPRILTGLFTSLSFDLFEKSFLRKKKYLNIILSSIIGSLTNTFGVLGLIFLFFGQQYENIMGKPILVILSTVILTNGIPEAIVSAAVCVLVCRISKKIV